MSYSNNYKQKCRQKFLLDFCLFLFQKGSENSMGKINDTLMCFAIKYNGDFDDILDAVKNHEDIDYDAMISYKKELRYKYTTMIKNDYPEFLKDTDGPPIVLFYEGNAALMNKDDTMIYSVNSNKHRFIVSVKQ